MTKSPRTARERWTQFVAFVVVWSAAAVVASVLLFYVTAEPDPPSPVDPVETVSEASPVPTTAPAPLAQPAPERYPVPRVSVDEPVPRRSAEPLPRSATPPSREARTRAVERATKIADHVRAGAAASETGDYDTAIREYDEALALEPNNFEVKLLRDQVESLRAIEARDAQLRFRESPTTLDTEGGASPSTSAELVIELLPAAPRPGDPYVLRIRAQNLTDTTLSLTSVELLQTQDSLKHERGRPTAPLARRLGAKENALLLERRSDWTVSDRNGAILVAVRLEDGSRLTKSLEW